MLSLAALSTLFLGLAALVWACRSRRATPPLERLQAVSLGLSLLFTGFAFFTLFGAQLGFVLGRPVEPWLVPSALAATAGGFWLLLRRDLSPKARAACLLIFAGLLLAGLWFAGQFYDTSYDGKAYHQEAILALLGGLNPLTEIYPLNHWVDDYPKLSWVMSAALAQWTPSIQHAKGWQALFLAATFFGMLRLFLGQGVRRGYALAGAALLALNPVVISQFLTFYVDGALYGLLAVLIGQTVVLARARGRAHAADVVLAALSGALCANLKFTGLVCAGLAVFCLCAFCLVYDRRGSLKGAVFLGTAVLLLALGLGASPYLRNLERGYHIFHPLMGAHKARSIIDHFRPRYMTGHNPVRNLLVSNFSRCDIVERDPEADLRNPFDFAGRVDEFSMLTVPDPRVGGFGPYMGATILLTAALAAAVLARRRRSIEPGRGKYALLLGAAVFGTTLVNPEAWWARYAPQFWMLWTPFVLWMRPRAWLPARALAGAAALVCAATIAMTGTFVLNKQRLLAFTVEDNLRRARSFKHPMVWLPADRFVLSTERLLSEKGVAFQYTEVMPVRDYLLFFYFDHGFLLYDRDAQGEP